MLVQAVGLWYFVGVVTQQGSEGIMSKDLVSKFVRVRYTGPDAHVGVYGQLTSGVEFSMSRADWNFLQESEGGTPAEFKAVGECGEDLPKTEGTTAEPAEADKKTVKIAKVVKRRKVKGQV